MNRTNKYTINCLICGGTLTLFFAWLSFHSAENAGVATVNAMQGWWAITSVATGLISIIFLIGTAMVIAEGPCNKR